MADAPVKSAANCVGAERQCTRPTKIEQRRAAWSKAAAVQIGATEWRQQVERCLRDGMGVEDIAIWLACHVSHIRAEVSRLRASGALARWWQ